MSTEAYSRNTARETRIWTDFRYSFPFNANETAERAVIFGLYAHAYLNGQGYLQDIESAELANLLADYTNRLAGLTNQEQIVVADIASKRYLAGIDKLIHDQKLATMQDRIDMENALADARYAALAADRAALETLADKVTAETTKTNARITELQTYIQVEGINLSQTDLEIAEKELQSQRVDNQKLDVANEILKIQMQTIRTAMELLDIDVQMARTQVQIADTERAIAKIGLLASELTIEQAQTDVAEAEIPLSEARITLAQARYDDADAELLYVIHTLMDREDTNYESKAALLNLQNIVKEAALQRNEEEKFLNNDLKIAASEADIDLVETDRTAQRQIDAMKITSAQQDVADAWRKVYAAINAKDTVLSANVVTQLTHTVQKNG